MKKLIAACAGLALGVAGVATAQLKPAPVLYTAGLTKVDPEFVTPIYNVNGSKVYGPTVRYADLASPESVGTLVFDSADVDPTTGFLNNVCLAGCANCRWYFGPTYHAPITVADITEGTTGAQWSDVTYAWYSDIPRAAGFAIIVEMFSEFSGDCVGFPAGPDSVIAARGFVSGLILTYAAQLPGGFFTHVEDITSLLLNTADASGAAVAGVRIIFADAAPIGGPVTLAAAPIQGFRWNTAAGTRPGTNGPKGWDDDNPTDGIFTPPTECYDDFTGDPCQAPDPNGFCFAIWESSGGTSPACCVDFNGDTEVDFTDVEGFLAALSGMIPGSCAPGADFNGDTEFDFSDIESFIGVFNTALGTICTP